MNSGSNVRPFRVLVLCTGNSARSQIGEALLAFRGGSRIQAFSAGSRPASHVNHYAVEVLAANGIEWQGRTPQHIDAVIGESFDLVITVCDDANEACPYFPGAAARVHWGLPDPAAAVDEQTARRAFADTFTAVEARIDALLSLPLNSLTNSELQVAAQAIHGAA